MSDLCPIERLRLGALKPTASGRAWITQSRDRLDVLIDVDARRVVGELHEIAEALAGIRRLQARLTASEGQLEATAAARLVN